MDVVAGDGRKRSAEEERRLTCEGFLPLDPLVGMRAEGERRILEGEGGRGEEKERGGKKGVGGRKKGRSRTWWTL